MQDYTIRAVTLKEKIDFGIITIRDDEFQAVLQQFPPQYQAKGERLYAIHQLALADSKFYQIAVVRCPEQGEGEAQDVARDMIEDLAPQWILVVGIAGAVPDDDFTLGDVVLATRLVDFCVGAALEGNAYEHAVSGGPMHKAVQVFLAHLTALEKQLQGWNDENNIGRPRPQVKLDKRNFYGPSEWQEKVKKVMSRHFGENAEIRSPRYTTAAVASSNLLIKNTELIQEWLRISRHIRAVEMELAGVYQAARRINHEYPILAIRGISDVVGFKRDPDWTTYACHSAAALAHALIKARPIDPINSVSPVKPDLPSQLFKIGSLFIQRARHSSSLPSKCYVRRNDAEKKILSKLSESVHWVSIEGDAGTGKTTLLVHLYDMLVSEFNGKPSFVPLYLDSAWFLDDVPMQETPVGALVPLTKSRCETIWDVLIDLGQQLSSEDARLLLLFDTLDLFLLSKITRRLHIWLSLETQKSNLIVVSACRRREAEQLPTPRNHIILHDFSENEAEEAIIRYVDFYYNSLSSSARESAKNNLLSNYLKYEPFKDVCSRPVTLRMMFEAYPDRPPSEIINRSKLYSKYWVAKVLGLNIKRKLIASSESRSNFSKTLALRLFDDSRIDLPYRLLVKLFENFSSSHDAFQDLLSEGVIVQAIDDTVRYFHQSFLEFVQAKAILDHPDKKRYLNQLIASINSGDQSSNLPVVQEIAVQAQDNIPSLSITLLEALLETDKPGAGLTAAIIWCYLDEDPAWASKHSIVSTPYFRHVCLRYVHNASQQRISQIIFRFGPIEWKSQIDRRMEAVIEACTRSAAIDPEGVKGLIDALAIEEEVANFEKKRRNRFLTPLLNLFCAFLAVDDNYAVDKIQSWYTFSCMKIADARLRINLIDNVASRARLTPVAGKLLLSWLFLDEPQSNMSGRHLRQFREELGRSIAVVDGIAKNISLEHRVFELYLSGNRDNSSLEKFRRTLAVWRYRIEMGNIEAEHILWHTFIETDDIAILKAIEAFILKPLANATNDNCFAHLINLVNTIFNNAENHMGRREIVAQCLIPYANEKQFAHKIYKHIQSANLNPNTLLPSEKNLFYLCASVLKVDDADLQNHASEVNLETLKYLIQTTRAESLRIAIPIIESALNKGVLPNNELRLFAKWIESISNDLPVDLTENLVEYFLTAYFQSGWQEPTCIKTVMHLFDVVSERCANLLALKFVQRLPRVNKDARGKLLWELIGSICSRHNLSHDVLESILIVANKAVTIDYKKWHATILSIYSVIATLENKQTYHLEGWLSEFLLHLRQMPSEQFETTDWEGIAEILISATWLSDDDLWIYASWILNNAQSGSRNRNKKLESILPPILIRSLNCRLAARDLADKLSTYHEDIQALLIRTARKMGASDLYYVIANVRERLQSKAIREHDIWARIIK